MLLVSPLPVEIPARTVRLNYKGQIAIWGSVHSSIQVGWHQNIPHVLASPCAPAYFHLPDITSDRLRQ